MATIANPVTNKPLCAAEVTSIFSTNRKSVDILLSEFDTSTGKDSSSFWESSDRDGTDATDDDSSIISGSENEVCTSPPGEVGSSSVEIESGTEGDDKADQVSEPPRRVLRPRVLRPCILRPRRQTKELTKLHTVNTTGSVHVDKQTSMSHHIATPPLKRIYISRNSGSVSRGGGRGQAGRGRG